MIVQTGNVDPGPAADLAHRGIPKAEFGENLARRLQYLPAGGQMLLVI